MIDPNLLPYLITSARLRGYADGLSQENGGRYDCLVNTMNEAADLLRAVWDEQTGQYDEKHGRTD
jgi:hypothetical protein